MKPLGNKIFVEEIINNTSPSGIFIPPTQRLSKTTVMGVIKYAGDGTVLKNGSRIPMTVKEGDTVIYKNLGHHVAIMEGVTYTIMKEEEVMVVL